MKVTKRVQVEWTIESEPAACEAEPFISNDKFPLGEDLKDFTSGVTTSRFTDEQLRQLNQYHDEVEANKDRYSPTGAFQTAVTWWRSQIPHIQYCLDNNLAFFLNGAVQSQKTVYYTALVYVIITDLDPQYHPDFVILLTNNITASKEQQKARASTGAFADPGLIDLNVQDLQTLPTDHILGCRTLYVGMASCHQVRRLQSVLTKTIQQKLKFAEDAKRQMKPLKVLMLIDESDQVEAGTAGLHAIPNTTSQLDEQIYRLVEQSQVPGSGFELQIVNSSATMVSSLYDYTRFWQKDLEPAQMFKTPVSPNYKGYRTPTSHFDPTLMSTGLVAGHAPSNIDFIKDRILFHWQDPVDNPYGLVQIATVTLDLSTKGHDRIAAALEKAFQGANLKTHVINYDFRSADLACKMPADTEIVIVVQNGNTTNDTSMPKEKIKAVLDTCRPKAVLFVGGLMISRAMTFECDDWSNPATEYIGGYCNLSFIAPKAETKKDIQAIAQMHRCWGVRPPLKAHRAYTTDHYAHEIKAYHDQDLDMEQALSQGPVSPGDVSDWYCGNPIGTARVGRNRRIAKSARLGQPQTSNRQVGELDHVQRQQYVTHGHGGYQVVESDWCKQLSPRELGQILAGNSKDARKLAAIKLVEQSRGISLDADQTGWGDYTGSKYTLPNTMFESKNENARNKMQNTQTDGNSDMITVWQGYDGLWRIYHYGRTPNSWSVRYKMEQSNGRPLDPRRPNGKSMLYPPVVTQTGNISNTTKSQPAGLIYH